MNDEEPLELSNEFATVKLRVVDTAKGQRLRVWSPRLGYRIDLDPIDLESLTWQDKDLFSELLQTPFGPEDELEPPGDQRRHEE